MTNKRTLAVALTAITGSSIAALAAHARGPALGEPTFDAPVNATMTSQQPTTRWSICGTGEYRFMAAGQPVGTETFDVKCLPDGSYSGTGRTQLGPLGMDLTTKLELGKDLLPRGVDVKGTVRAQSFDQTAKLDNGTATVTVNGSSQTVTYAPTASWLGNNIFWPNAFIVARYDDTKGGAQQIMAFPQTTLTIERLLPDTVTRDGKRATFDRYVMRVAAQEIAMWRDAQGRLAVIGVPSQQFAAARAESAEWVDLLLAAPPRPVSSPGNAAPTSTALDYSAPAGAPFTAEEVKIAVGTYELAGTLLVPKSGTRHAAAVMITGSGLQTRDSRLPLPGLERYAPFRQIAERLATNGVAVLRVDDRGSGASTGRETLEKATTSSLAEDTRAQVAWLRQRPEIDAARITLIGHSEGAAIAAMIAATDPRLRSIIMMAGTGKRGADVALEQFEDLLRSDTTLTEAAKAPMRAKQEEAVKTVLAGGDVPGTPVNAWTREYFAYDPLVTIRRVKQPILILQGAHDRQVDQAHATLLADAARGAGNKSVTVKVFPTLNHLFVPSKTGSFNEYSRLETTTLPDAVLDAITSWFTAASR